MVVSLSLSLSLDDPFCFFFCVVCVCEARTKVSTERERERESASREATFFCFFEGRERRERRRGRGLLKISSHHTQAEKNERDNTNRGTRAREKETRFPPRSPSLLCPRRRRLKRLKRRLVSFRVDSERERERDSPLDFFFHKIIKQKNRDEKFSSVLSERREPGEHVRRTVLSGDRDVVIHHVIVFRRELFGTCSL